MDIVDKRNELPWEQPDEGRAECGCPIEDVVVKWCEVCGVNTVFCFCNLYGTCQCS
jgi:hypothetical protein